MRKRSLVESLPHRRHTGGRLRRCMLASCFVKRRRRTLFNVGGPSTREKKPGVVLLIKGEFRTLVAGVLQVRRKHFLGFRGLHMSAFMSLRGGTCVVRVSYPASRSLGCNAAMLIGKKQVVSASEACPNQLIRFIDTPGLNIDGESSSAIINLISVASNHQRHTLSIGFEPALYINVYTNEFTEIDCCCQAFANSAIFSSPFSIPVRNRTFYWDRQLLHILSEPIGYRVCLRTNGHEG